MTEKQWLTLLSVINGEKLDPIPIGFIIEGVQSEEFPPFFKAVGKGIGGSIARVEQE